MTDYTDIAGVMTGVLEGTASQYEHIIAWDDKQQNVTIDVIQDNMGVTVVGVADLKFTSSLRPRRFDRQLESHPNQARALRDFKLDSKPGLLKQLAFGTIDPKEFLEVLKDLQRMDTQCYQHLTRTEDRSDEEICLHKPYPADRLSKPAKTCLEHLADHIAAGYSAPDLYEFESAMDAHVFFIAGYYRSVGLPQP
eukprot:GFYU01009996.1.p1 GENE.GFYU01009996.1~~GFYU01009996.1.p1  ORF type:complete len:195 (+),score=7.37 GFYU01009996.1:19-603(+)